MMRVTVLLLSCCLAGPALAGAGPYQGEWSYQALNAGDTSFKVEQHGDEVTFYRVLYPEYEGSRYKLEHIYRGRLAGDRISGHLYVREEGMADFERLRPFSGRILDADHMRMDDLPLARSRPPVAVPPPPRYQKVVIADGARAKPPAPEAPPPPPADPETPPPKPAPLTIPTLVPVGRKVAKSAVAQKAQDLLDQGDGEYARKRFDQALARYEAAFAKDESRIELLYKLGLCHGILGSQAVSGGDISRARGHYRQAIAFWERAHRLDPYNWGAAENIRRARSKLTKMGQGD